MTYDPSAKPIGNWSDFLGRGTFEVHDAGFRGAQRVEKTGSIRISLIVHFARTTPCALDPWNIARPILLNDLVRCSSAKEVVRLFGLHYLTQPKFVFLSVFFLPSLSFGVRGNGRAEIDHDTLVVCSK